MDIEPGDLLVQPVGWFYQVHALSSPKMSVSYFWKYQPSYVKRSRATASYSFKPCWARVDGLDMPAKKWHAETPRDIKGEFRLAGAGLALDQQGRSSNRAASMASCSASVLMYVESPADDAAASLAELPCPGLGAHEARDSIAPTSDPPSRCMCRCITSCRPSWPQLTINR